jgi:tRNA-splicing ligase RtcB
MPETALSWKAKRAERFFMMVALPMGRTKALQSFTWSVVKKLLAERDVTLLSAGLDEVPGAYKDIDAVMAAQTDLVEVLGRFDPKLLKMCPSGERAED